MFFKKVIPLCQGVKCRQENTEEEQQRWFILQVRIIEQQCCFHLSHLHIIHWLNLVTKRVQVRHYKSCISKRSQLPAGVYCNLLPNCGILLKPYPKNGAKKLQTKPPKLLLLTLRSRRACQLLGQHFDGHKHDATPLTSNTSLRAGYLIAANVTL